MNHRAGEGESRVREELQTLRDKVTEALEIVERLLDTAGE